MKTNYTTHNEDSGLFNLPETQDRTDQYYKTVDYMPFSSDNFPSRNNTHTYTLYATKHRKIASQMFLPPLNTLLSTFPLSLSFK